jgi:hypothetical protein
VFDIPVSGRGFLLGFDGAGLELPGTMAASALATITTLEVVLFGEHHETLRG